MNLSERNRKDVDDELIVIYCHQRSQEKEP